MSDHNGTTDATEPVVSQAEIVAAFEGMERLLASGRVITDADLPDEDPDPTPEDVRRAWAAAAAAAASPVEEEPRCS